MIRLRLTGLWQNQQEKDVPFTSYMFIDIEDYEIPDVKVKAAAGTKKKINYFD